MNKGSKKLGEKKGRKRNKRAPVGTWRGATLGGQVMTGSGKMKDRLVSREPERRTGG